VGFVLSMLIDIGVNVLQIFGTGGFATLYRNLGRMSTGDEIRILCHLEITL